jgi:hypothetical protein
MESNLIDRKIAKEKMKVFLKRIKENNDHH